MSDPLRIMRDDPKFWEEREARLAAIAARVAADVARLDGDAEATLLRVSPARPCRTCGKPHRSTHGRCWTCRRDGRT